MPVYIVTGKLGSGKTLSMIGRMREYMLAGKPVATNIGLNLRELVSKRPQAPIYLLPDRPTSADLEVIGAVHDTGQEERNGALVLDECATWLNARAWNGEDRAKVIDWMLHSRKLGWDVYLIVQNISLLDKQLRDALAEYVVHCRRLDRMRIPGVGRLINALSLGYLSGNLPKVHMAAVRYGTGPASMHADTWVFRGRDLYAAFSTAQVIGADRTVGVQCMTWMTTEAEQAEARSAQRAALRPKLPHVERLMRQPAGTRVQVARRWEARGLLAAF